MAVESLSTIREKDNPILLTQALLMTSEMYFHTHHLDFGLKYLQMAAAVVANNGLRFVMRPKNSAPGTISVTDEIRQRVGLLSQLLYVETELFLLTGRKPNLFEELEAEFEFDLAVRRYVAPPLIAHPSVPSPNLFQQVAYPRLSKTCPVIMRAGGVILIKDAAHLKEDFDRQSEAFPTGRFSDGIFT